MSGPPYSSSSIMSFLPVPIPSDGTFTVTPTITDGSFSSATSSSIYSNYILSPSVVVGSETAPYLPVALPAYVSTLYQNVYNVNNNLQDNISAASTNDRHYPTSYAVQKYVQSQISGTQILSGSDTSNNGFLASNQVTNTLISLVSGSYAIGFTYVGTYGSALIAQYNMDNTTNATRAGASKTVIFADNSWLSARTQDVASNLIGNLAFLYAGENCDFIVAGQTQNYYQFTFLGDFVSFVMAPKVGGGYNWLVTNYQSRFSKTMDVYGMSQSPTTTGFPPMLIPADLE